MALLNDLALSSFEGRLRLRSEPTSGLGDVELNEVTAPGTPAANRIRLYAKDQSAVSALFYKNDAGTEINLSGSLTGTGVANRIAFWSDTTVLSSDADLTFLTDTLTATKVVVSNANTAGSVLFASATGITQDNASFFYVDADNDLVLGSTSVPDALIKGRGLYVARAGSQAACTLFSHGNTGLQGNFNAVIPRGTLAVPTATQSGDGIGFLVSGHDNSAYTTQAPAAIFLVAAEAWTSIAHGSDIRLGTTALGATSRGERFRIGPSGQWGIGGATYGTAAQYFRSAGAAAAPTWATIAASEVGSGTALTKTDDTNVTLTLGGTPTTALLAAASITAGWTGTLGVARGGTNLASYAVGDLLYASGATTLAKLADVAAGAYLRSGGLTTAPLWSTLILPNSATVNYIPIATGANTWGESASLRFDGTSLALGGAIDANSQFVLKGSYTPAAGLAVGMYQQTTINGIAGSSIVGSYFVPTIVEAGSGNHGVINICRYEGTITPGAGTCTNLAVVEVVNIAAGSGTTNATTLKVTGESSGASNNYALWVTSGKSRFGGNLMFDTDGVGAGTASLGTLNCPAITLTAPYTWITALSSDGSTVYMPAWK